MIPIAKPFIGKEEKDAVQVVLDSGMLAQGPKVKELEEKFARFCGSAHAVAVNNGTSSLHTGLYAAGIKPGDEVITTPFTFVASANCIIMQNAKPVFADIKEDTFNIDPEKVKEAITPKTKAILFVDIFGQVADVEALNAIADEHGLKLIEDACQAHGAEFKGKRAGTFGDVAGFSLYATKNMMCGEGGIMTTDDEEVAELARRFRHHGQSEKTRYEYYDLGYNYRMMDVQAAIALAQLDRMDEFTERRIRNAERLTKGLSNLNWVTTPVVKSDCRHVFHQYTIKVDTEIRDKLVDYLKANDVGCGIFYPKPLHLHPFFRDMGYKGGDFPVSEKVSKQVVSLPVHHSVSDDDVDKIIDVMGGFDA